jgi:hypothetical protein
MCRLITMSTSVYAHQPFVYDTKLPSIVGGILQSRESEHTLIFLLVSLFLDAYYILFYAILLSF